MGTSINMVTLARAIARLSTEGAMEGGEDDAEDGEEYGEAHMARWDTEDSDYSGMDEQ